MPDFQRSGNCSNSAICEPSPPPELIYPPYHFDWPALDLPAASQELHPVLPSIHARLVPSSSLTHPKQHPRDTCRPQNVRRLHDRGWQEEGEMTAHNGYRPSADDRYGERNHDATLATLRHQVHGQFGVSRRTAELQSMPSQPSSRPSSRPESPIFQVSQSTAGGGASNIASYLQLPVTITPTGGSLAEFAAKITSLFWFESAPTLASVEEGRSSPPVSTRLETGFLKWVTTILTTTQVSPNVILLALLFIYRLKKQNPSVKGKPGSEYRLLTVALMLGNKFLDDNTYTNKTWAEVSGIAVQEIHVMEVEFLSHMKYNLYTSKEEWHQWHQQLRTYWLYFDHLSRPKQRSSTLRPLNLSIPYALPSPPSSIGASPPYAESSSPFPHGAATLAPPPASASAALDTDRVFPPRKRSWDEAALALEPLAKRQQFYYHPGAASSDTAYTPTSQNPSYITLPSLSVPNLQSSAGQGLQLPAPSSISSRPASTMSLPPVNWPKAPAQPANMNSALGSRPSSFAFAPSNNPSPTTPQTYPSVAAHSSSNTNLLSPSHYLTHRNSPYKPVRNISTLLVPPSSGQIQSNPQIPYDQMSWMPLGRRNDHRTGLVPYLHRDAWPKLHQSGD